ncbi:hypothetical protein KCP78_23230 [Salmonella enterica subsp. enterica]|nr:hypothetical protein KCP78_23230 [Salmonella enterica subsp. enterica]
MRRAINNDRAVAQSGLTSLFKFVQTSEFFVLPFVFSDELVQCNNKVQYDDYFKPHIICAAFTHGYWVKGERKNEHYFKAFLLAVTLVLRNVIGWLCNGGWAITMVKTYSAYDYFADPSAVDARCRRSRSGVIWGDACQAAQGMLT